MGILQMQKSHDLYAAEQSNAQVTLKVTNLKFQNISHSNALATMLLPFIFKQS